MEHIRQLVYRIPPVTRYWIIGNLISAFAVTSNVSTLNFLFEPSRAFGSKPWILVTSFLYHDSLSFGLAIYLITVQDLMSDMEKSFRTPKSIFPVHSLTKEEQAKEEELLETKLEQNKTIDFLYHILIICISIIAAASLLSNWILFNALGPFFINVLYWISSKSDPEKMMVALHIFIFPRKYCPWILTLYNYIVNYLSSDFMMAIEGKLSLGGILNSPRILKPMIMFSVGQILWFFKYFTVTFYRIDNRKKVAAQNTTKRKVQANVKSNQVNLVKLVSLVFIPPWYWKDLY